MGQLWIEQQAGCLAYLDNEMLAIGSLRIAMNHHFTNEALVQQ